MTSPLISVLMPVHAMTAYTVDAVNSVLTQTHQHLELLIIGQHDVAQLVAQLPTDHRIRAIARTSTGIVGALNSGLAVCEGEYIARMDSDDLCHPNRLATQLQFACNSSTVQLLGAQVDLFSDAGVIGRGNARYQNWLNALTTPEAIAQACFVESPLPHPSLFAHQSYWQQMQGYRDKPWPEDYDLILRTWLAGIPMAKPTATLLQWREHPQRLTHTDQRYSRQAFIRAKAWAAMQAASGLNLQNARPVWICGTGRNARYWHDALVELDAVVAGFVELDSAKQKTQKRHLPVISYTQLERQLEFTHSLVVCAVSNPQARTALHSWFSERHCRHGHDFILGA